MDPRSFQFSEDFRDQPALLMRLRRDMRRFRTHPVDEAAAQGHRLGTVTMSTVRRSWIVAAITRFRLTLRVRGLGTGRGIILVPARLSQDVNSRANRTLIRHFRIGFPEIPSDIPEFEARGWDLRCNELLIETR